MDDKIGGEMGDVAANVVTYTAALNWALIEFLDTDLLADTLSLDSGTLTLAYAVIAVATVVSIYNLLVWQGVIDDG
jgi:uncharacterized membrane protein YuzA (DUF378 family)